MIDLAIWMSDRRPWQVGVRRELRSHVGSGRQKINTVSTTVHSASTRAGRSGVREDVLRKLERIAGHRLSQDCVLVLTHGGSYAERNREDALRRLIELIGQATKQPQQRTQTAPTWAAGVVACEP